MAALLPQWRASYTGMLGLQVQDPNKRATLRSRAKQGDALAQGTLGNMYRMGKGVPEDNVLAHMWYNLAAAQGSEPAQSNKDRIE